MAEKIGASADVPSSTHRLDSAGLVEITSYNIAAGMFVLIYVRRSHPRSQRWRLDGRSVILPVKKGQLR